MKKILMIIGGIVVGIIIFVIIIFFIISISSKKMVCKSDEGSINLLYNDKEITGYTSNNMGYNLDEQQEYSRKVGIEAYLEEFSNWFSNNTTGKCNK